MDSEKQREFSSGSIGGYGGYKQWNLKSLKRTHAMN